MRWKTIKIYVFQKNNELKEKIESKKNLLLGRFLD
jgi:hypothetical protein